MTGSASATTRPDAEPDASADGGASRVDDGEGFHVHLDNFDGPFDLLLQLISRHQLDVTTVSLSRVTDEFVAAVREGGRTWSLDVTTNFLLVAATLLDLKAARLLPTGEVDDPDDLALLEARDLLFARLLQYRAFKVMSGWIAERLAVEQRQAPRPGGLEPRFAELMPEVELGLTPDDLAALAVRALTPRTPPVVPLAHLHQPSVSVPEQAALLSRRLQDAGELGFRELVAGVDRLTLVGRFLALLELFRNQMIAFEQPVPLGELRVRWTGDGLADAVITDEYERLPVTGATDATPDEPGTDQPSEEPMP